MESDEAAELRLLIQSNRGLIESLEGEVARLESRSYAANRRLDKLERQRDAAQGNGEEGRSGGRGVAPEARATRALWLLNPQSEGYSAIYEGTVEEFREVQREAMESEAALRAQLAEREAEIARLRSELQLVTSPHESVGAVLRGHEQTIARLRTVLEAVWITVPSQFSGPETEQHAKVLNSIPRAIAADWPAVRAAGVALPGEE